MVLLLIVINLVFLVALAALWEARSATRRARPAPPPGDLTLRMRTRPSDGELVRSLLDRAGGTSGVLAPPVWGDRLTLIEGSGDEVTELLGRLVEAALDSGFHVTAQRERRVTLRRRFHRLTIELSPA